MPSLLCAELVMCRVCYVPSCPTINVPYVSQSTPSEALSVSPRIYSIHAISCELKSVREVKNLQEI